MRPPVPPPRRRALRESVPPHGRRGWRRVTLCSNGRRPGSRRPPLPGSAARIEHVLDALAEQPRDAKRQRRSPHHDHQEPQAPSRSLYRQGGGPARRGWRRPGRRARSGASRYAPDVIRRILHIDMDAFYASVEQRDRPELRGRPVAVGGSPTARGVVAAASYESRAFGVRSAMPMAHAVRLCPELMIVPPDFVKYRAVSQQVFALYRAATTLVEPLSLDEAYLDVTENAWGEPLGIEVAKRLKAQIRDATGLTASAGVAPNKFLAKIASGWRKPD